MNSVILFVDNKDVLNTMAEHLKTNYKLINALNGKEALYILEKEAVQLIISNIQMPAMDGYELCRVVKTSFKYSHIPMLFITTKITLENKIKGLELGADAYIEKPFPTQLLKAQIVNLLNNQIRLKKYFTNLPLIRLKSKPYAEAGKEFLEKLKKAIHQTLEDVTLDVAQLARIMNMSRPTLYRKIKEIANRTPNEIISEMRLEKAAELLADGRYKNGEVAEMVGYSSQNNFGRNFLKQFGITSTVYASLKLIDKEQYIPINKI